MNRRGFLFGATALALAPALVRADSIMRVKPPTLILHGDNVHDDTIAMNAFLSGKRVWSMQKRLWVQENGGRFSVPDGHYNITGTINAGPWETSIEVRHNGAIYSGRNMPPGEPMFHFRFPSGSKVAIPHCEDVSCVMDVTGLLPAANLTSNFVVPYDRPFGPLAHPVGRREIDRLRDKAEAISGSTCRAAC